MLYKTEMHLHTSPVSHCGIVSPDEAAAKYIEAGYSTLVLTNHMSKFTFMSCSEVPWETRVKFFISGYHDLKKAACESINVLLGMELRLDNDSNDYLVYGVSEDFLLGSGGGDITKMNISTFAKTAQKHGLLIFQAHPFRNTMNIIKPGIVGGVEVYNGHASADNRNDIADMWAEKYSLRRISGTDYHNIKQKISGGITTESPIKNNDDLISILKSGGYKLIQPDAV